MRASRIQDGQWSLGPVWLQGRGCQIRFLVENVFTCYPTQFCIASPTDVQTGTNRASAARRFLRRRCRSYQSRGRRSRCASERAPDRPRRRATWTTIEHDPSKDSSCTARRGWGHSPRPVRVRHCSCRRGVQIDGQSSAPPPTGGRPSETPAPGEVDLLPSRERGREGTFDRHPCACVIAGSLFAHCVIPKVVDSREGQHCTSRDRCWKLLRASGLTS